MHNGTAPFSALAVKYRQVNNERAFSDNPVLGGNEKRRGLCWTVATPDVLLVASALTPFFLFSLAIKTFGTLPMS